MSGGSSSGGGGGSSSGALGSALSSMNQGLENMATLTAASEQMNNEMTAMQIQQSMNAMMDNAELNAAQALTELAKKGGQVMTGAIG